jgi:hypothetical protein
MVYKPGWFEAKNVDFERPMKEKECFGILQRVFPMGAEGLREVRPGCFECSFRIACLRAALLTPDGVQLRFEMVDRAASKGMMGRLEQWSRKKELSRLAGC